MFSIADVRGRCELWKRQWPNREWVCLWVFHPHDLGSFIHLWRLQLTDYGQHQWKWSGPLKRAMDSSAQAG